MQINLHSHTYYSDGKDGVGAMTLEAQKMGLSAHVITDHYSPANPRGTHYSLSHKMFEWQRKECNNLRKYLKYDIIQGIELNLYHEEILLFGVDVIRELFEFVEDVFDNDHEDRSIQLIEFIKERKNRCACVLCHPLLNLNGHPIFYKHLFEILDGFEKYNAGRNWFENREIPSQISKLKQFNNSDAHSIESLYFGNNNEHKKPIRNEHELIKFIKGKRM